MIKRIVLTGGPCAGKTTVLSKIENFLLEQGYKVFIVGESATELISGGITPHEDGIGMLNFQRLILSYQYRKEEIYNRAVMESKDKDIVIIYDRGLMDNKAYISDLEFAAISYELSQEVGYEMTELDILKRYDMVIHLETSAVKQGYSLENNKARYESAQEAVLLDKRTFNAWRGHNNLHMVESTSNFEDKVDVVLSLVKDCLVDRAKKRNLKKH